MRRVVHMMPFYDVPGRAISSGAENHLYALMEGQVKAGLCVELLMIIGLDGGRLDLLADTLRAKGIKVVKVLFPVQGLSPFPKYLRPLVIPHLARLLRERRDAVIHTHVITPGSQLFVLAARLAGCKALVNSFHNMEPELAAPTFRWRLQLLGKVTRRTIAISRAVRDHLVLNVGLSPSRTRVVYYGIEPPASIDRTALRAQMGVPAHSFLFGLVGRLVPQKDIHVFLEALAECPEVHGVIIGGGELEDNLKGCAAQLGLTNVTFAGARANGPDLIGAFDVMVLCSKFEGLGLVLLEAMIRHVPVIATKAGAISEILDGGRVGRLINVGDTKALAAEMIALKSNAGERTRLAQDAFARVQTNFTVPVMVASINEIYEEALGIKPEKDLKARLAA